MIRRFRNESEDFDSLYEWYDGYGMRAPDRIPQVGYIVPGVAAGFLYQTDSDVALLEGYISNPAASSGARHEALDEITAKLLTHAADLGFRSAWAITQDAGISLRAEKHKMDRVGNFVVLVKEIH